MRKGFSLIELLIVVSIISALVGVAVPFFQDNLKKAQEVALLKEQQKIERTTEVKSFMCFSTEKGMACRPVIEKED